MNRLTITLVAASLALAPAAMAQNIGVQVNGQPVTFSGMGPQQVNGRVMVPLRGVLEQMGADVHWNEATQTVTATRGSQQIELPIGSRMASVNGRTVNLDVPATIMNGTTMVPLRFVGEALGADVRWDGADQLVMINTNGTQSAYQNNQNNQNNQIAQNYTPVPYQGNTYPPPPAQRYIPTPPATTYPPSRAHRTMYGRMITLPAGTVIPVTLDTPLSSSNSRPGDRFTATVQNGSDNAGLPDGTRIEGVVRDAIPAANNQPGIVDMDFRRIVFPNGDSQPINASVTSLDSKSVQHTSEGRLVATNNNRNQNLKWVGIGAGAGLLLGAVTKGNTLLDTLLGAGAGYLFGQTQNNRHPSDVKLAQGTQFGVRLDNQIAFRSDYVPADQYQYQRDDRFYTPGR